MNIILGFVLVIGLVFGGYLLSGGELGVMRRALLFGGMMSGGGALGAASTRFGSQRRMSKVRA